MNNVIKPNTKIKILSEEHSKYVQELAFKAGFSWPDGDSTTKGLSHIFFKGIMTMSCLDDGDDNYFYNGGRYLSSEVKHMTEIFIPMPDPKPKPPFKIRNANHPVVRQWLKDMGIGFRSEPFLKTLTSHLDRPFSVVDESGCLFVMSGEDYFAQEDEYNNYTCPELTLDLAVQSWSLPDPVDQSKLDRMKKIEELEQKLAELKEMEIE